MTTDAKLLFSNPLHARVYEAALPFLRTRRNDLHTRVCYRFALQLLEREGGNADVVIPAILLHDIGWSKVPEDLQLTAFGPNATNRELQRLHETEGARMAAEILETLGYDAEDVAAISRIVLGHDSKTTADSKEEAIVKDADKLWRYSREGFDVDPERFGSSREQHLARLRPKIDPWFLTPAGLELARAECAARELDLRRKAP